jgi:hypothetical protein
MPIPPYPTILTQSDWNKKKGLVAKIVAEPTKLGEALKKAEKAYKDVHWDILTNKPGADVELKAINDQIAKAGSDVKPQTTALKTALQDVKTQATAVKGTWSTNKLIPKDAKTHVDNLLFAVTPFMAHLDAEIKAAMLGLFAAQQKRAFLNEKEEKEQAVKGAVVRGPGGPKKDVIATKFKKGAPLAGKKPEKEDESSVVESESEE